MTEGNTDPSDIQQRLTVKEAAAALGISSEAVRTRIQRGTLRSIHERGRVWVVLDHDGTRSNTGGTVDQTALVDELRARVAFLERELRDRTEENRRKDHLLAAALDRIPAIEAPESPTEAAAPRPDTQAPPEPETPADTRPWWRRVFGGKYGLRA